MGRARKAAGICPSNLLFRGFGSKGFGTDGAGSGFFFNFEGISLARMESQNRTPEQKMQAEISARMVPGFT